MKQLRIIPIILCLSLLLGLTGQTVYAAEGTANLNMESNVSTLRKGDTVQVMLSISEMRVSSFAGGIFFDTALLECVSIEGIRPDRKDRIYLQDHSGDWFLAAAASTLAEANASGTVGFVWIGTENNLYSNQSFAIITFRAVAEGTASIYLFENSAGTDGIQYDSRESGDPEAVLSLTIQEQSNTNAVITADKVKLINGGTVRVTLSVDDMTVSSFTTGIHFDPTVLSCVSIEGTRVGYPEQVYLHDSASDYVPALAVSTVSEANNSGSVGFAWVSTDNNHYPNQEIAVITFQAITDENTAISLYEDSAGADGRKFVAQSGIDEGVINLRFHTWMYFTDITESAYFFDAVVWASENGITAGTDAEHFSPYAPCTRAQAVTFLWRAAGSPAPVDGEIPFTDVVPTAYYFDAVCWAYENNITKGTSETSFSPGHRCRRSEIVTFLWRSHGSPSAVQTTTNFTDVPDSIWYSEAVRWAVENGITVGTSATSFSPNQVCNRAQIVTFLYRAYSETD